MIWFCINKFALWCRIIIYRDAQELAKKEFEITAQRELFLLKRGVKVKNISAFAKINEFLFTPLYD
ncbi:hypothetical protein LA20079_03940 [Lactobacillus acidophilus]|nr:hypothetical protein LA20079_03940 [Lactobacillus acidophilus]